jgi:hypothetical protein
MPQHRNRKRFALASSFPVGLSLEETSQGGIPYSFVAACDAQGAQAASCLQAASGLLEHSVWIVEGVGSFDPYPVHAEGSDHAFDGACLVNQAGHAAHD